MALEDQIAKLIVAIEANTAALQATPSTLVSFETGRDISSTPEAQKAPIKIKKGSKPEPVNEPAPETETAPAAAEPEISEETVPTKVVTAESGDDRPQVDEFVDPLDTPPTPPKEAQVSPEEIIGRITETWKTMLTTAEPARKTELKDAFPQLREKWGLKEGEKLATLSDKPENLLGLLRDIEALAK